MVYGVGVDVDDPRAEAWRHAVRQALTDADITGPQLAEHIGVTRQAVNHWVTGARQPPEPDLVFQIEHALGCPGRLSRLLGYQPPDQIDVTIDQLLDLDPLIDDTTRRIVRQIIHDAHHRTDR